VIASSSVEQVAVDSPPTAAGDLVLRISWNRGKPVSLMRVVAYIMAVSAIGMAAANAAPRDWFVLDFSAGRCIPAGRMLAGDEDPSQIDAGDSAIKATPIRVHRDIGNLAWFSNKDACEKGREQALLEQGQIENESGSWIPQVSDGAEQ
jgi:hypothetical protein